MKGSHVASFDLTFACLLDVSALFFDSSYPVEGFRESVLLAFFADQNSEVGLVLLFEDLGTLPHSSSWTIWAKTCGFPDAC
jgi:hypothetical protein